MIVYLIRHGQTEANLMRIIQGQTNTPLTETGFFQVRKAAEYFNGKNITAMYASPLGRTMQTAKIIAAAANFNTSDIICMDELMEINLAPWVGKQVDELIKDETKSGYKVYKTQPELFNAADGENIWDVKKRMFDAFWKIVRIHPDDSHIVIVSHSVAIRSLLLALEGKPYSEIWKYPITPASITEVRVNSNCATLESIGLCPY